MNIRLLLLWLKRAFNWRLIKLFLAVFYLLLMILFILNMIQSHEFKASSKAKFKSNAVHYDESQIPASIKALEELVVPGAGQHGQGVNVGDERLVEETMKKYAFNKLASDKISWKRDLPDVRHAECKKIRYDEELPKASVIIIFNNEMFSTLLRTVWSVIRMTPERYLHEIVLVDDASNITDITQVLPLYIKYRLNEYSILLKKNPKQLGLIGARLEGAKAATGDAIIFLDSHCEATEGWIQPLLQRIKDKPTNIVIPSIDGISDKTLQFHGHPGGVAISVGGFTWSGHFTWIPYRGRGRKASDPAPTATMAGGLFGADRKFFFHIGAYDPGMSGWGGENLELSFRTWRCGGSMENVPCSHVGHIFRSWHPYFIPEDSHGINTARMAEVWMDDYKRLFYMHRQDLKRDKTHPVEIGDIADRMDIKKRINCKSFKWYLDNIYPEKFIIDEQAKMYGRFRSKKRPNICIDHLQKDTAHHGGMYLLGQYPCHGFLGDSQYFSFSENDELRNEYMCAENSRDNKVQMYSCHGTGGVQSWKAKPAPVQPGGELGKVYSLKHVSSGLCLTSPNGDAAAELVMKACDEDDEEQLWHVEITNREP